MELNEKGSSLIQVLLVILVFTVLGLALMGNVIGENKRTHTSESNMQARYLAESGLTYFEKDFNDFIENANLSSVNINDFPDYITNQFLLKNRHNTGNYNSGVKVNNETDEITVTAKLEESDKIKKITNNGEKNTNEKILMVTSTSSKGVSTEKLTGYYELTYKEDTKNPTMEIATFEKEGLAVDFAREDFIGLELLNILGVKVLDFSKEEKFYPVPTSSLVGLDLIKTFIHVDLDFLQKDENRFQPFPNNPVIATSKDGLLSILLKLGNIASLDAKVNILDHQNDKAEDGSELKDTNVLIDGSWDTGIKLPLGLGSLLGTYALKYDDITFEKLAVLGNVIIKQDKVGIKYFSLLTGTHYTYDNDDKRTFIFNRGLFVNKSLVIGGKEDQVENFQGTSKLKLAGKMVAMDNLEINSVNLEIGNSLGTDTVYVHKNATISNTCLNKDSQSNIFRLLVKGKTFIENNSSYSKYKGLFYSENGIYLVTYGKKIIIDGGLLGNVFIYDGVPPKGVSLENLDYESIEDYKGQNFEYIRNPDYFINQGLESVNLRPLGRSLK